MRRKNIRLIVCILTAGLMLGAVASCFGGDEEAEPTPDIQATIDAAVAAAKPTDTPTPEPTPTVAPTEVPTPDIAQTVAAAIAAVSPPTAVPPTAAPEPTAVPTAAPTDTPVPTSTPVPTPTPTLLPEQSSGPPCIIAGEVTIGNSIPPAGTAVFARSQTDNTVVETETDADGRYVLTITHFDMVFDLYVRGNDSRQDTPVTSRGCRVIKNLRIG
ncbi:MAG: carboxypeptidase regulatory-like domain-containing protein [Chloroflexi bacterium]|nr:carboxypeptidase regulatory-like domain-containing protein [Chloroflexota bacterium]